MGSVEVVQEAFCEIDQDTDYMNVTVESVDAALAVAGAEDVAGRKVVVEA